MLRNFSVSDRTLVLAVCNTVQGIGKAPKLGGVAVETRAR